MSRILAVDLGKFNSVLCWYDATSGEVVFRTAKTTPAVLRSELLRERVERVVIEAKKEGVGLFVRLPTGRFSRQIRPKARTNRATEKST